MRQSFESNPSVYVVMNPVSGTNEPEIVREKIRSTLDERHLSYEIYETTGKENLKETIQEAVQAGYRVFLAVGGDGTIAAVANGLAGTGLPLVIIPNGTWNGLARNLDIPLHLIEFRRHHEEDDQQEQHIDERREVQDRHFVEL